MPIFIPLMGGVGHTRLYMHCVLGDFQFQRWIVVSRRVFSSVFEPYEPHDWEFSKFMVNAITGPPTPHLRRDPTTSALGLGSPRPHPRRAHPRQICTGTQSAGVASCSSMAAASNGIVARIRTCIYLYRYTYT